MEQICEIMLFSEGFDSAKVRRPNLYLPIREPVTLNNDIHEFSVWNITSISL